MRSTNLTGVVLLVGLFFWCEPISAEPLPGPREVKAMQVGEDYVAANFKFFTVRNEVPKVEDKGDYWLFYYALPPDMIGGSPTVEIDKQTFKVIRAYMTQ